MKILPFEEIIFHTALSKNHVLKILSNNTGEPIHAFKYTLDHNKPFEGSVSEREFKVWRVIRYRNSFLPRLIGVIDEVDDGCNIKIQFRLHRFVSIFMIFWFSLLGIGCLGLLLIIMGGEFNIFMIIPFGMFLFGAFLTILPFKYEVKKAKQILNKIFEVEV